MKKSLYLGFVTLAVAMTVVFTACKDDEPEPPAPTFTVAFNTGDGGPTVASKTGVASGCENRRTDVPTKAGFDFGERCRLRK
ncbi:MAG: hypothetical protein LBQ77_00970 [Treponema sp.]|jgi:hypothetical protein|nr:hypothetical protein [Treponema sp.]